MTINDDLTVTDDLNVTGDADVDGSLQFGAANLYGIGYASDAQEIACGSQFITGTATITLTGLTTVTYATATLASDPGASAGDPFIVSIDDPSNSNLVVNVWQDDATAATGGATVHWCAVGDQ